MYGRLIDEASSGVNSVLDWMNGYELEDQGDGLTLLSDDSFPFKDVQIPDRLHQFLLDIRLLRRIPLSYLVPDAALLPPESIRFFHVDLTWVDRVVDGVVTAANIGTADLAFTADKLRSIRDELDEDLVTLAKEQAPATWWTPRDGVVTGMLIRSELTRRWPDMIVRAFETENETPPVGLLRCEPVSTDVHITLFAGAPKMVQIREPFTGVRFGVESATEGEQGPPYKVDRRTETGEAAQGEEEVDVQLVGDPAWRVLDWWDLVGKIGSSSSLIALHLEQRPYLQLFLDTCGEEKGSQPMPDDLSLQLSSGRVASLAPLLARAGQRGREAS